MLKAHKACMRRTSLASIYREYDFGEIATVTRSATAKALGLKQKGHLGVGADGDVSVYDIDPTQWRPSKYEELEKALSRAAFTIKEGEIVVKDGELVATPQGTTLWADVKVPEEAEGELLRDLELEFKKYYTISLRNYPVQDEYLPKQERLTIDGRRRW
jgi:formylmethanofuran dehydrogenase subunit A